MLAPVTFIFPLRLRVFVWQSTYVIATTLVPTHHNSAMYIDEFLGKLLFEITEENYEQTLSDYRLWMGIGAMHGWISDDQLYRDIQAGTRPDRLDPSSGGLIHTTIHLLLRLITDIGLDPVLSAYSLNIRDQLFNMLLKRFFEDNRGGSCDTNILFTNTNFLAHSVNLGYVNLEDVRDHLLQSCLTPYAPSVRPLYSLVVLLKISGATFAAYVDPSVLDRCFDALRSTIAANVMEYTGLVKVRGLTLTTKELYECWGI